MRLGDGALQLAHGGIPGRGRISAGVAPDGDIRIPSISEACGFSLGVNAGNASLPIRPRCSDRHDPTYAGHKFRERLLAASRSADVRDVAGHELSQH